MEYFDVLDKNRKPLNKIYPRGTNLNENEYNAGVEIYITCQNKLLMGKRCMLKSHPLEWEVPGGCSQASEDSLTTLYRELKEEINLDLNIKPKLIDTIIYKNQFVDIYTVELPNIITNFKLQKEEVSNIKKPEENQKINKSDFQEKRNQANNYNRNNNYQKLSGLQKMIFKK